MSELPFNLSIAPFPQGFSGDMDETFQQAYALTTATVEGNFLTGLILPPGSTLPTNDQGPIAMGETWWFWDAASGQYIPQAATTKGIKNYVKNSSYWIYQNALPASIGGGPSPSAVATPLFDMTQFVGTQSPAVTVSAVSGPTASGDTDLVSQAVQYTSVSPTTINTGDWFAHEHMVEGFDIVSLKGQVTSLSFSILTQVAGTYSCYLTNGPSSGGSAGRDASYVANFTVPANVWTRVKIPGIPPFPNFGSWHFSEGDTGLYLGIVLATGNQWKTTNLNQWLAGRYIGSNSNINFLAVGGQTIAITAIKLEPAAAPTYYMCPSFTDEYDACSRYFFTTFNYQVTTGGVTIMGVAHVGNGVIFAYTFPRRMCKPPVVALWNTTGTPAPGNITNGSTGTNYALSAFTGAQKGIAISPTTTATKGDVFTAYLRADARLT